MCQIDRIIYANAFSLHEIHSQRMNLLIVCVVVVVHSHQRCVNESKFLKQTFTLRQTQE